MRWQCHPSLVNLHYTSIPWEFFFIFSCRWTMNVCSMFDIREKLVNSLILTFIKKCFLAKSIFHFLLLFFAKSFSSIFCKNNSFFKFFWSNSFLFFWFTEKILFAQWCCCCFFLNYWKNLSPWKKKKSFLEKNDFSEKRKWMFT